MERAEGTRVPRHFWIVLKTSSCSKHSFALDIPKRERSFEKFPPWSLWQGVPESFSPGTRASCQLHDNQERFRDFQVLLSRFPDFALSTLSQCLLPKCVTLWEVNYSPEFSSFNSLRLLASYTRRGQGTPITIMALVLDVNCRPRQQWEEQGRTAGEVWKPVDWHLLYQTMYSRPAM